MAYSYDFSDPLIVEMVCERHRPRELYDRPAENIRNVMIAIECCECRNLWPCEAISKFRDWAENGPKSHLKVVPVEPDTEWVH